MEPGITCTGGTVQRAGLPEFLGQQTGLEIRIAPKPTLAPLLGEGHLQSPEATKENISPVATETSSPFYPALQR